jgi:hypothetical protein
VGSTSEGINVHRVTHEAVDNIQASAWVGCVQPPGKLQEVDSKGEIVRNELLELVIVSHRELNSAESECSSEDG